MIEVLKQMVEALECALSEDKPYIDKCKQAIKAGKQALAQPEHKCNSHPKAPHGFNRNASHANDRYTCECESWDAYEAGYQAGVTAGIEMSTETEQKPVAWLGFNERGECREVFTPKMKETFPNYPTADMIPVYTTPPQPAPVQEPVAWKDENAKPTWPDDLVDDPCPSCGKQLQTAKGGGTKCSCGYWFCF